MGEAPVTGPALITEYQAGDLIRFAREELNGRFSESYSCAARIPSLQKYAFEKINITIRTRGKVRASMSGRGADLPTAISSAIGKCIRDARFGPPLGREEIAACVIELWIQTGGETVNASTSDELERELLPGVDGVEVHLNENYAYYKPSVAITSDLTVPADLLGRLCLKAGLQETSWQQPAACIRRTHWIHAVESATGGARILWRLRLSEPPSLDQSSIESAAHDAARRLVAGQDSDGLFLYRYDPLKDRAEAGPVSSVRHAGCAYSLAALGSLPGEGAGAEFSWSAARALRSLVSRARAYANGYSALYIPEAHGSQGKLGTSALTLLALQFDPLAELFAEHRQGLCEMLVSLQDPAGWFRSSIHPGGAEETNQDYYPGEALAALGRELRRNPSGEISAAFERAFPYYRDYFRRRPNTAFILWHADAWRLFDEVSATPGHPSEYADFVFEMVDWLLRLQYTAANSRCPEYIGGFPRPAPPRYSSACYTEAVVRACGLALRHGLAARAMCYRDAARAGLSFVRRLQVGPESAFLFPRPERAVGGISANLSTFAMRSDFDQHAITAFLAAIEVSREWPAHAILDP